MGLGINSFLSDALLNSLKNSGITFLYQARNTTSNMPPVSYWKDSYQLGLIGDQAIEWDRYKRALVGAWYSSSSYGG
jgi:hypothetical protein